MRASVCLAFVLWLSTLSPILSATVDLGNGFADHGVATPISNHRGTVATVDGQGHRVILSWLMDHRGGYELLLVDVDAGSGRALRIEAHRYFEETYLQELEKQGKANS